MMTKRKLEEAISDLCRELDQSGYDHEIYMRHLTEECNKIIYGAKIFSMARKLLLSLPKDIPPPKIEFDSDGDFLFDWIGSAGRMLTMALREDGRISYAVRLNSTKTTSVDEFLVGGLPAEVIEFVRSVTSVTTEIKP